MIITDDLFLHKFPLEMLDNNFKEEDWVYLYKHEKKYYEYKESQIEIDDEYWTYLTIPNTRNIVLQNFIPEVNPEERSIINLHKTHIGAIKKSCESIIKKMDYFEVRPIRHQLRINEELIYMFHLFEEIDNEGNRLYFRFECGESKLVIKICSKEIRIRSQLLNDFLTSRKMNLVCYVRSEVNIPINIIEELNLNYQLTGQDGITTKTNNSITNLYIMESCGILNNWLSAKKIISYKKYGEFKSTFDSDYADFIIGYDTDSCSTITAAANDEKYKYHRIYFQKGVLEKYRSDASAYIGTHFISTTFMGLKCENTNANYVSAFLKDIGALPYSEQLYWKSYNKVFSEFETINGWPTTLCTPDFIFREIYQEVNQKWRQLFGWNLFRPLTGTQSNLLGRVYILGDNNPSHFKTLILYLNTILTDSLDDKNIDKLLEKGEKQKGNKSISKLTLYFKSRGYDFNPMINFLLQLNTLRSEFTDAHRNKTTCSDHLNNALDFIQFKTSKDNYKEASINLFIEANKSLRWLLSNIDNLAINHD